MASMTARSMGRSRSRISCKRMMRDGNRFNRSVPGANPLMLDRFRRRLARFLSRFEPEPPFGLAVPADAFTIRDGVNYALPIIVPPELSGQAREEFIQAAIKEATAEYHFQFDRSYSSESPFRIPIVDPLTEWDFVTRRSVLASCHSAAERNPIAKAPVKIIRLFTMGAGLTINYQAEDVA